jgi:hypothetical protein
VKIGVDVKFTTGVRGTFSVASADGAPASAAPLFGVALSSLPPMGWTAALATALRFGKRRYTWRCNACEWQRTADAKNARKEAAEHEDANRYHVVERKSVNAPFSKIETVEQAEDSIRTTAYTMYVVAGVHVLAAAFMYPNVLPRLSEAAFVAVMGFILRGSRSRWVAGLIAMYATAVSGLTLAARMGLYSGGAGQNIFIAAVVLYESYRGWYATIVFHRLKKTVANIRTVVILSSVAIVLSVLVFVGTLLISMLLGHDLDRDEDSGVVGGILFLVVWAVWVAVFNRLLPFIRQRRITKTQVNGAVRFE